MFRKWIFAAVAVSVALIWVVSSVLAAPESDRQWEIFKGTISQISGDFLTLTIKNESDETFLITQSTKVKIPSLKGAAFSDLEIGWQAVIKAIRGVDGSLTAVTILVIPGKPTLLHRVGTVTEYLPGASITIQDKSGELFTFLLTPETKILPPPRADELSIGSLVTIICPRDVGAGELTAKGIVIHPEGIGLGIMEESEETEVPAPIVTDVPPR